MSASAEITFYWAWLIISVWENEPKLKETTINYFELRPHWLIKEYTREKSETVKQYTRIEWEDIQVYLLSKSSDMTALSTFFPQLFDHL